MMQKIMLPAYDPAAVSFSFFSEVVAGSLQAIRNKVEAKTKCIQSFALMQKNVSDDEKIPRFEDKKNYFLYNGICGTDFILKRI